MLGLSQSIRNKKDSIEREKEKKDWDCQNVAYKDVLAVTRVRGLMVITFSIYLDLLILNSFQLTVWKMSVI